MDRLRTHLLVLLTLTVVVCAPALGQEQDVTVRIGVLAKRGPERCLGKWSPTAEYLTNQIPGRSFVIVPLAFDEVCPAVERGQVDFVLANPSFYVELEARYGVNRLATLKNLVLGTGYTRYGGVIFQRADREEIKHLGDLKGKTFMATADTSFGGWRAAWRELKEHGIDPRRDFADLSFGGTHDAVVYAVRDGKVDAGTVRTDTLERMAAEGKIRLEDFHALVHDHTGKEPCHFPFLHSTDVYPEWPLAELAHTSDELAEKVAVALLNMPADCPAARAARCAGWTVPLNYQPVHDCLKELRVGPYKDFGKVTAGDVLRQYWPGLVGGLVAAVLLVVVVVYTRQLNRTLTQAVSTAETRARQQAVVAGFGQMAHSDVSLDELFDQAVAEISQTLGTKYAEVLGHVPEQQVLFLRAGVGWKEGWVGHKSVPDGVNSQGGYTLLQDKPVVAEDIHNETRFSPPALLTEHNVVGGMTVAIPGRDRPFGILGVHTDRMQRFSEDDAHFLEAIANVLAGVVQRQAAKDTVAARTVELEQQTVALAKSRRVAMGMMEDAEAARKVAEAAEEELRGAKDYTDNIIRSMIDMLVVVSPDGRMATVNEATCSLLGYRKEELIGQPASLLFSEEEEEEDTTQFILSQEALPVKRTVLRRLMSEGFISDVEKTLRAQSGQEIPVLLSGSVMRGHDGEVRGIVCVAQDITQRKLAEQALQRAHRDLNQMFNAAVPLCVISTDHEVLHVNDTFCSFFAMKREDVLHRKCYSVWREPVCGTPLCPLEEIGSGAERSEYEVTDKKLTDGRKVSCAVTSIPYRGLNGQLLGIVKNFADITRRRAAEMELRQAKAAAETANESLREMVEELETFNRLAVGRELRMIELKQEINELLIRQGQAPKFEMVEEETVV